MPGGAPGPASPSAVQARLRKVLDQVALKQFDAAGGTLAELLAADPGKADAIHLRAEIVSARKVDEANEVYHRGQGAHEQGQIGFRELEVPELPHVVEFPDREKWVRIRNRQAGIQQDDPASPDWVRDYEAVLRSRKVTLNLPETPFSKVVSFLQDITGLNITVWPKVDQFTTVSLRLKDIPLQDALAIVLGQTGLAMDFANDTLLIAPPADLLHAPPPSAEARVPENDFVAPSATEPSTFAVDVDTAGYALVRQSVLAGRRPTRGSSRS